MDNNGCNVTATIELQIIDCTSISETVEQSILLFPNPNSGEFSIYHQAKNDKISVINIYDTRNRLIESRRVNYSNNNLAEKFQLNNNDKGIYFVEMIGDKGTYFQKVVLH
ncbi:T9SS type A sorting domain-containing protein [Flavobacteriales bacterium]|nr:T9SS type A sorting domain-containing protein [Flavobacteriales bacterium]